MARRGRRSGGGRSLLLLVVVVLAIGGAMAWWLRHHPPATTAPTAPGTPAHAAVDRIDPGNEGRTVQLRGVLKVVRPARDASLAIQVEAVMLLRDVEMLQWQEHCAGTACRYALEWSPRRIDARAFREPAGHRNDTPFPFTSESFPAAEVRLGAYAVDATLAVVGAAPQPYPVTTARLPPNLAATFRNCDGALCTGDPKQPAAGDLRVAYRIVPAGSRSMTGVQQDGRLVASQR
jgi:hypothetical protein